MTEAEDLSREALRATALGARFPEHSRASGLLPIGATVLVAVSGGRDSVVLLHLLRFLAGERQLRLVAAHFDHRMREGSAADADWVAGLCRAWDVPLEQERASTPPRSEAEARAARYRFLHAAAARRGAARIATAHHADDQAETVLFRIIRGTGLRGLTGIPERRGPFVRPLLPFRRAEIAAYARAAGLTFRHDPTNFSLRYARNRLRLEILPRLEAIAPGAAAALVRLADHARAAEAAWDQAIDALLPEVVLAQDDHSVELARPLLLSYHPYLRARMLRRLLRRFGSLPGRTGTRAALEFISFGASGGRIQAAGGVRLEREFDRIRIRRIPAEAEPTAEDRPLIIEEAGSGSGEAVIGGRRFTVHWTQEITGEADDVAVFDAVTLRFPLEVRRWRAGDRIRMPYGTKKLKKLFAERRVGRAERVRTPVVAEAGGRVLWVVDIARAHGMEPRPSGPGFQIAVIAVEDAGDQRS